MIAIDSTSYSTAYMVNNYSAFQTKVQNVLPSVLLRLSWRAGESIVTTNVLLENSKLKPQSYVACCVWSYSDISGTMQKLYFDRYRFT